MRNQSHNMFAIVCMSASLLWVAAAKAETFKLLPAKGIEPPAAVMELLKRETQSIRQSLQSEVAKANDADTWRGDVEVFIRGAELAIDQTLFYKPKDVESVQRSIKIARDRLTAVTQGTRGVELLAIGSSGKEKGRTLAGGFVSALDGSVQPYGMVLPDAKFDPAGKPIRLDVWLHGRGDTNTEVPFLLDRLEKVGEYSPAEVVVLHPFGRHCNAYKFAGEADVYEAIAHVAEVLPVDEDRISIRGFSMGGAGCWHLATHNPGFWFAANPGAGFVDTVKYQGWENGWPYEATEFGRRLMSWYDLPPCVDNLSNTQVIAYSGEIDKQRAGAEMMIDASLASTTMTEAGAGIEHVIGKGMGHKIDEPSKLIINGRLAEIESAIGARPRKQIHFVTYTLRYNRVDWMCVEGLQEHWKRATIDATIDDPATIRVLTSNVAAFCLDFTRAGWPLKSGYLKLEIDGEMLDGPAVASGEQSKTHWQKVDGSWQQHEAGDDELLQKRPGLQGPIDDALTAPLLFVLPSRPCRHGVVQRFVDREVEHARSTWRRIMRGDDRVVMDKDLTPEQIASHHLICFGDFQSNRYLATIASALPIRWTDDAIHVGDKTFDPSQHAPVFVYPNPGSPDHYVVVNSGITFRESSNGTNSRQIAMLPDWAIIDVSQPADGVFPGRVVAADFFDESWQVKMLTK